MRGAGLPASVNEVHTTKKRRDLDHGAFPFTETGRQFRS
jgi:hypothetical protein